MEIPADEARASAEKLYELFQGKQVIEDTEVESKQRAFLWNMMLQGVITVETQERPRPEDGRKWRYFYWHLVPPERLARSEAEDAPKDDTVYDELPATAWKRPGRVAA